ncbi:MAG: RtcB family protein [Deltaproteobacteria bacterium]|nr:RtcB family protein [Deltaproteobacteria bacterium]MBW2360598.1 RtcB family protein [Deltaproteobacteria bacterium]
MSPAPSLIERVHPAVYELPTRFRAGMRVPVRVFATEKLLAEMDEKVFEQAANVATLPGIVSASFAMPDAHWGYGFPIGGVAAMDPETGVISPGGIGFDINCGMRLVRTDLSWPEVKPRLEELVDALAARVPAGVGRRGFVRIDRSEFCDVLRGGAQWAVEKGYGWSEDLRCTEAGGRFETARPECVSERAIERGYRQIGTLGSGNHYLEVQVLHPDGVFDAKLARAFGLDFPEQVVIMFHCGSRGFGHQVATDYLHDFLRAMPTRFGLPIIDRELACAPLASQEGRDYLAAMGCAANMSFANRQVILHRIREVFSRVFGRSPDRLGIRNVYDVAHNTAKLERHRVNGRERTLLVHRKGATRAFPPGHPELPDEYRETGQPVIIGGSMETGSYLLAGTDTGAASFFSTAHGSGRTMSRRRARKLVRGRELRDRMEARGILVRSASYRGLAEEAGFAYKDVDEVAEATELAGLSRRVAHLVPVANVKG